MSSGMREGQDTDLNLSVFILIGSFCVKWDERGKRDRSEPRCLYCKWELLCTRGRISRSVLGLAECTQY